MEVIFHPALCLHEIGQRENNEDNIYPEKGSPIPSGPSQLFLVCDGVGGAEKGEVASKIVCDIVSKYLKGLSSITALEINEAIELAETTIDTFVSKNEDVKGMATTLTLLAAHKNGIAIAHLGDSRVYHIRAGKIIHKTSDHSFVNELVSKNIITEAEALNHPKKNVVTKAIMGGKHQAPDVTQIQDVLPNDYFFLCTDGITESVTDKDLVQILSAKDSDNVQKIEAIRKKCESNSKDNHSAYLLQVKTVNAANNHAISSSGGSQIPMYAVLFALIFFTLGFFWMRSDKQEENANTLLEKNKIESSLSILDEIDVDEIEDLANIEEEKTTPNDTKQPQTIRNKSKQSQTTTNNITPTIETIPDTINVKDDTIKITIDTTTKKAIENSSLEKNL